MPYSPYILIKCKLIVSTVLTNIDVLAHILLEALYIREEEGNVCTRLLSVLTIAADVWHCVEVDMSCALTQVTKFSVEPSHSLQVLGLLFGGAHSLRLHEYRNFLLWNSTQIGRQTFPLLWWYSYFTRSDLPIVETPVTFVGCDSTESIPQNSRAAATIIWRMCLKSFTALNSSLTSLGCCAIGEDSEATSEFLFDIKSLLT